MWCTKYRRGVCHFKIKCAENQMSSPGCTNSVGIGLSVLKRSMIGFCPRSLIVGCAYYWFNIEPNSVSVCGFSGMIVMLRNQIFQGQMQTLSNRLQQSSKVCVSLINQADLVCRNSLWESFILSALAGNSPAIYQNKSKAFLCSTESV